VLEEGGVGMEWFRFVDEQSLFCFGLFIEHERWRFCVWDGQRHMYSFVDITCFPYFLRRAYMGQTDAARRGRGGMGVPYSSSFMASDRCGMVWYIDMEELYCRILQVFHYEEVVVFFVPFPIVRSFFGGDLWLRWSAGFSRNLSLVRFGWEKERF
jgi:hypothetical protein